MYASITSAEDEPVPAGSEGLGSLDPYEEAYSEDVYMYDEADHDSKAVADALGESLPIGGYFCAGEIGPIGVKGLQQASSQSAPTFLHGFTSVLALVYDTSAASSAD